MSMFETEEEQLARLKRDAAGDALIIEELNGLLAEEKAKVSRLETELAGRHGNPSLRPLLDALAARQADYRDALDNVLEVFDDIDNDGARTAARSLREAIELVGCLRRLVPVVSVVDIHRAFGAPGDFGYETPVGDALARLYRTG